MTVSLDRIDNILENYSGDSNMLIQVLLRIQKEYGWLPKEGLAKVGETLDVPLNRVYQVATFYRVFSLVPRGRHLVTVCMGTACHVRGSLRILQRVAQLLSINPGETTPDFKFSLEAADCLGCCNLGPVMVVDGQYHGRFLVSEAEKLLTSYD